jgi:hypothetical protein
MQDNLKLTEYTADEFESLLLGPEFNGRGDDSLLMVEGLGLSWGELSKKEFTNHEKLLFGLRRGNVGVMFAVTNLGKTTLTLNIALTMAAGRTFDPFVKGKSGGYRVMLIDGESTQPELKADIERMTRGWSEGERELLRKNFHIICDAEIDEEALNLSNRSHMPTVTAAAKEFKPDLIIVDTLSALFTLKNENDNAEIKSVVMQPLKKLAKESNAVVWMLHHVGKQSEDGRASVGAYLGRGGSNIGALARAVTSLKKDTLDSERVIFTVEKAKGFQLKPVLLHLDRDARWFITTDETLPPELTNYEQVVSFVKSIGRLVKRKEIDSALADRMSVQTITRSLNEAVTRKDLISPKYGHYAAPDIQSENVQDADNVM